MGGKSKFVWHDFMAAEVGGAKRFYGELFGWTFKPGDHDYEHIVAGGREIGGIMKLDPAHGAPPHWIGYVSVDDVDAACATATKSGGKIYMPKMDIPKVGQFAVCADPQGAVFSPFHYTGEGAGQAESNDRPGPYTFCWDELVTSDPDGAARFYATLFGWSAEHLEMPGFGRYTLLKRTGVKDEMGADKNAAGVMSLPPGVPHPFWMTYVAVESADKTADKVKKLGGTVMKPPADIPDVGRFVVLMDPQHAALAVLQPNAR
ncbi:MAG: Glyoxalase-like domain protein [bacterium]|nr:Glyoxalase-like domain protein [bacterium]